MDILREIGVNLSKQRALLADAKKDLQRIQTIQTALQESLSGIWSSSDIWTLQTSPQQWKAFVDLVASGRVLSVAAQANDALKSATSTQGLSDSWVGDGRRYASWLGKGVATLSKEGDVKAPAREWQPTADLCGKAFYLGHTDEIIATIIVSMLVESPRHVCELQRLLQALKAHEQRKFLLSTIKFVSKRYLMSVSSASRDVQQARVVAGAASLLSVIVASNEGSMGDHLSSWMLQATNTPIQTYRAVLAALPEDELDKVLEQLWAKFSDQLFIKHVPVVQQETMTCTLLLLAGRVHRKQPMALFMLAHSSFYTSGVSERLSSSSLRVRFLGMVVGSAVSQLVDKPETRMKFDFEGDERVDFAEMNALLKVDDKAGSLDDLPQQHGTTPNDDKVLTIRPKQPKSTKPKAAKAVSKIQVIEDEDEEDDDLVPYGKPDSDPDDSDEDPTLVQRKKPKAPVYIRDLITQLANTEDADIQELALTTAPSLLRRKADFGTELSDRAVELCATFFDLSDPFNLDNFLELRLQGMIALLVAQPKICGPYFATTIFEGDFNADQRVAGLTAIGLAARELAGYKPENDQQDSHFPSKTLPERLHKLYLQTSPMDHLTSQLSSNMLHPISTTQKRPQRRLIRNDLSKIVAECFFFPLTGNFASHSQRLPNATRILPTLIKTLAIILTSAGPTTLTLPQLTAEMFALLLSLRTKAVNDQAILEAVLFGFLSTLNVNEDKRSLAERQAKEVVETHEWCNVVFDRLSAGLQGVSEEEERVKTLCAGVLVATKEVIESYERLMVGELVEFGG